MEKNAPQVVSLQLLTTEDRVLSQGGTCVIYGGQSDTKAGFSSTTFLGPCLFQFHQCCIVRQASFEKWTEGPMKNHVILRCKSPSGSIIKYALSNVLQDCCRCPLLSIRKIG
jgi:hypothetical protein